MKILYTIFRFWTRIIPDANFYKRKQMNSLESISLARDILEGNDPSMDALEKMADIPENEVLSLMAGADMIRNHYFGGKVHLCTICNGKSGKCSENCSFCSQSAFADSEIETYPLMEKSELQQGAVYAEKEGFNRYSIVTSGKRLPRNKKKKTADAIAELGQDTVDYCASLGILDAQDFEILKKAGVTRYHHNLETAQSHFDNICTTHSYEARVNCIKAAQEVGLSICSGGIFGVGETDRQALELSLALRDLDVDAVPINFLIPIPGSKLEGAERLTPLRCLKIISLFRFVLPDKEILICGGREANLKQLHPLVFFAGASGIMTGNYLTAKGREPMDDKKLIEELGLQLR